MIEYREILGFKVGVTTHFIDDKAAIVMPYGLNELLKIEEQLKKLKQDNEKLRECVEFYAKKDNWVSVRIKNDFLTGINMINQRDLFYVGGKKARQTLKEINTTDNK